MPSVALIGSSGGGCANLGSSASSALAIMQSELEDSGITLSAVQFVHCACPLDRATNTAQATLWVLDKVAGSIICKERGSLSAINESALQEDNVIAESIRKGEIDGLISISSNFDGIRYCLLSKRGSG
jgi:hypothetical protein